MPDDSSNNQPKKLFDSTFVEDGTEPWARRKDESQRAFAAFCLYRDAPDRRLSLVAAGLTPTCSTANIARWSMKHNWKARAWAFDNHLDELARQQLARDRIAMRSRHLKIAMAMQQVGAHALAELQQKIEMKLPLNMSADEAQRLLDAGAKLERQTMGTEKESRFTKIVVNLGTLTDDDLVPSVDRTEDDPLLLEGEHPKKVN